MTVVGLGLTTGLVFAAAWLSAAAQIETHVEGVYACYPADNPPDWHEDPMAAEGARVARSARLADALYDSDEADARALAVAIFSPEATRLSALQSFTAANPDNELAVQECFDERSNIVFHTSVALSEHRLRQPSALAEA